MVYRLIPGLVVTYGGSDGKNYSRWAYRGECALYGGVSVCERAVVSRLMLLSDGEGWRVEAGMMTAEVAGRGRPVTSSSLSAAATSDHQSSQETRSKLTPRLGSLHFVIYPRKGAIRVPVTFFFLPDCPRNTYITLVVYPYTNRG